MATNSKSLIQIVPSLWPAIDGIGDYALQLARQLRAQAGVETSFIVCDPVWRRDLWSGEFEALGLKKRSEKLLLTEIAFLMANPTTSNSPILLHFSPYGYETRGCPMWLVGAMEAVNKQFDGRLNIAFHELDVDSSRILSSTYWVPGLQRLLMRRLLHVSRFTYTNTNLHQSKLEAWGRKEVSLIPNFSNIGELDSPPPLEKRERSVVIFGRADQRRWTYAHGADALAVVCARLQATKIIDIGAPIPEHTFTDVNDVPVVRRGVLPAEEVALVMRSALANFMYYPVPLLTKSGVHALACASGTVSFICSGKTGHATCTALIKNLDYIVVEDTDSVPSLDTLERLAPAVYESYCKRTSKVAALAIAKQLYGCVRGVPDLPFTAGSLSFTQQVLRNRSPNPRTVR